MGIETLDSSTAHRPDGGTDEAPPPALLKGMVDSSAEGLILLGRDGSLLYANEAAGAAFGRSMGELSRLRFWELAKDLQAADWADYWSEIRRRRQCVVECHARSRDDRHKSPLRFEASMRYFELDDEEYVSLAIRSSGAPQPTGGPGLPARGSFRDTLVGVPNRELFVDQLARGLDRSRRRSDYGVAVLVLDVDRLSAINETRGHSAGDQLLTRLGARLQDAVRPGDCVTRLDGGTFAVLLDDIRDINEASRTALRLQEKLKRPFSVDGEEVMASVGIGIAFNTPQYECAEDQLRDAECAMRRAKAQGSGSSQVFDQEVHVAVRDRLNLEADLRDAVTKGELYLDYQPIVELETGRTHGFEALVRWRHPRRGLVQPLDFIPLAEETDLVIPIDRFVLKEACRQYRRWDEERRDAASLSVSVNFSGRQFGDPDLVRDVEKVLNETGFDPRRLQIEITESEVMNHPEVANTLLRDLKALGVMLSIDDFGTGYSSLSYLHSLPVDTLKMDRSFVSRMSTGDRNDEIVKAIITLSLNLGLRVVAEGIETEAQRSILRELGCDLGQGALFALPAGPERALELIAGG